MKKIESIAKLATLILAVACVASLAPAEKINTKKPLKVLSVLERPVVIWHTWLSAPRDFCSMFASRFTQQRLTHVYSQGAYSQGGGPAHQRNSYPFSFQRKEMIR